MSMLLNRLNTNDLGMCRALYTPFYYYTLP